MKKLAPWCDHFVSNDCGTEYGYSIGQCPNCEHRYVNQAFKDWKFCPWCGAHRPKEK